MADSKPSQRGNRSTGGRLLIEDYALIGDLSTAALVGRNGSIDWLCLPRFDSPACFARLVGSAENGYWQIHPHDEPTRVGRRYRDGTLVLETEFHTETGSVCVIDLMPHAGAHDRTDVIRLVEGRSGEVVMRSEILLRFDYGAVIPWIRRAEDGFSAIAGPDAVHLRTPVPLEAEHFCCTAEFTVRAGQKVPFVLTAYRSHHPEPEPIDADRQLAATEEWWRDWSSRARYSGPWRDAVIRSLITIKALTYGPTGGIVAAPTTSLPEAIGGMRNWDYRYCWIRDATFTLYALLTSGYRAEAQAWREWLLRAVAGQTSQMQILYGIAGERRITEMNLPWLGGYEDSVPVRIGNDAYRQLQLDTYGELMDAFQVARQNHVEPNDDAWQVQQALVERLESDWDQPDEGLWEVRGQRRHFTHSKVMAWVAMDRAVRAVSESRLEGPAARWAALRDHIHADVCRHGFDSERNTFVQHYGGHALDAALLMIPLVGFLPPDDPRVVGTLEAIRRELEVDGLVRRYNPATGVDGLPGHEGVFLPCTFWLIDNLALMGRRDEAEQTFERLLGVRNDVGLLSEEYDPRSSRLLGNFPQAFSHVGQINSAHSLSRQAGPSERRSGKDRRD